MRSLLLLSLLVACGGENDARVDAPPADDAAPDAADPRGPATYTLAGGANSLLWDAATTTLYLTDSNANALLKWTDAGGFQQVGMFPAATAGVSLGDLVRRGNGGTILTPSFGFGTQGTLFALRADGTSQTFTGLDPARRRVGLAQDPAGVLYVGYFVGAMGGPQTGGVARLMIAAGAGTETEIAGATTSAGLKKIVGVAATADAVFAADATDNKIYRIALPGLALTTVATVPSADLLTLLPNGDLLTGGTGVHRITRAGAVTTIFTGFEQVRGLAYDPAMRRLFIIEHSATAGVPDRLHVRPLDG